MSRVHELNERQQQIHLMMKELWKKQDPIVEKQKKVPYMSEEYIELRRQEDEISKQIYALDDELVKICDEIVELCQEESEKLKETRKQLEKSGFFEKLERYDEILENPDKYTNQEVEEAQEFENGLKHAFVEYAKENPDGLIQIACEDD